MNVIEKQLEYLNNTMKDTASEGNSYLLKYYFGGLIAIFALLNIDLVLLRTLSVTTLLDKILLISAIALTYILSSKYFSFVLNRYQDFLKSHRKLKYKYELTLHFLLCKEDNNSVYQFYLEQSVKDFHNCKRVKIERTNALKYDFESMANYLLNHHQARYRDFEEEKYISAYKTMAKFAVILALLIRGSFWLIGYQ